MLVALFVMCFLPFPVIQSGTTCLCNTFFSERERLIQQVELIPDPRIVLGLVDGNLDGVRFGRVDLFDELVEFLLGVVFRTERTKVAFSSREVPFVVQTKDSAAGSKAGGTVLGVGFSLFHLS